MASLGFATDEHLLNNLIEIAQTNKADGRIDFEEFLDLMTVRLSDVKSRDNLKEVFQLM
jgi:Ca2+-binding EF-hand superfamily protein